MAYRKLLEAGLTRPEMKKNILFKNDAWYSFRPFITHNTIQYNTKVSGIISFSR